MSVATNSMQKNVLYTLIIVVSLIVIMLVVFPSTDPQTFEAGVSVADAEAEISQPAEPSTKNTIASAWHWEAVTSDESQAQQAQGSEVKQDDMARMNSGLPFTEESVYKALHAVKLDSNDELILDDDALIALNAALDHQVKLDAEALAQLQSIIRKGLPGAVGEQTAQIVADYYQYLGAKNDFNALYETKSSQGQSIDDYETQYNELLSLREVYLGADVAEKLFATSNANSRYMFESMKLEADESLSDEEKKLAQAENIARHAESTTNVDNWAQRYQAFSEEKQYILNSSIADDEKRDQLRELMHQHFTYEELDYVSHLELDSL